MSSTVESPFVPSATAPPEVHDKIEIPASLSVKLTAAQLDQLQNYANEKGHKHSVKHIVAMEKAMAHGKTFEEAHEIAQKVASE